MAWHVKSSRKGSFEALADIQIPSILDLYELRPKLTPVECGADKEGILLADSTADPHVPAH